MFILKNLFKLAVNAISKDLVLFRVFLEKILKLILYYWVFGFRATIMLMLLLYHYFAEKQSGIKDLVELVDFSSFEIIFALLVKVIAVKI